MYPLMFFINTAEGWLYYFTMVWMGIVLYTVLGMFLVYSTPNEQLAQVSPKP